MSERFSQTPSHDEFRDDLAAYALGALEEPEAARLEAHLEGCDECRRHLRWLEPAVDVLPRTVEQVEPPAQLRAALMDAVRAEAPDTGRARPHAAGWWRRLGTSMWRPATAVAATAMLIVGVVAGYLVAEPGGGGTTTFEAQAMPNAPDASGTLARDGSSGILRVEHMPTLAASQVYEVWIQRDGELEPSSLFVPRSDRSADAAIPERLDGADAVLVTKEPRGGSKQPTTPPLLSVQLN